MNYPEFKLTLSPHLFFVAKMTPSDCGEPFHHFKHYQGDFISVTQTVDEISVVGQQTDFNLQKVLPPYTVNRNWSMFHVCGTLDFELVGILSRITGLLSQEGVPVFCLSTFNTDYVLVKQSRKEQAIKAFKDNGIQLDI